MNSEQADYPSRAIFSIYVYSSQERHKYRGYYNATRRDTDKREYNFKEIEKDLRLLITDELQRDVEKILGLDINIRIFDSYSGSAEIVFEIAFNTFQFIAGIKGFYDSIKFVNRHTYRLARQKLDSRYKNNDLYIDIQNEYPSALSEGQSINSFYSSNPSKTEKTQSNNFFKYLFVSNILLTIALLSLKR